MHDSTKGKVVIISGGGRGLGRAMALGLVEAGAKVTITASREGAELEKTASDARKIGGGDCILALKADVTSAEDCERVMRETLAKFGVINGLVNNAGRGMSYVSKNFVKERPDFWSIEPETWRMMIDTNVNGIFLMTRAAVPHLLDSGWGRIVNISTSLRTMQRKGFLPYGVSKWACEGQTVIMAQELEDTGVTVNVQIPGGATDTAFIPGKVGDKSRTGADGHLLEPEVMVPPILYLMSDLSNGRTGDRYVSRLWDTSLPPEEAAGKARFPVFRDREF
ncbi:MAG: SDR family oxidoreductase [Proteobacteria bacterium]|nr:SDR family oxidoreductase [Pseudomonadota bacterium]